MSQQKSRALLVPDFDHHPAVEAPSCPCFRMEAKRDKRTGSSRRQRKGDEIHIERRLHGAEKSRNLSYLIIGMHDVLQGPIVEENCCKIHEAGHIITHIRK